MNRSAGIAVLLVGLVLVGWGLKASDSLGSEISRFFNGVPTDKTIWLSVGGAFLVAMGLGSLLTRNDRSPD